MIGSWRRTRPLREDASSARSQNGTVGMGVQTGVSWMRVCGPSWEVQEKIDLDT